MDFSLTESQVELSALTRRILSSGRPAYEALDAAAILDPSLTLLEKCTVLVEIGRAAAQIPYLATVFTTGDAEAAPWFMVVPEAARIVLPDGSRVPNEGVAMRTLTDGTSQGALEPPPTGPMADLATLGVCAQQLGVLERALEMTAAYAGQRVQFGRPIGTFQAVAQRLADAFTDVEAVRLTMWQAAWKMSQGMADDRAYAQELAIAKFWAADAGHRVAHTAVHVHGGVGIDLDSPVHRYFVMAKRLEFSLGHATDQLRRLGSML